jgi:hypothetical protein
VLPWLHLGDGTLHYPAPPLLKMLPLVIWPFVLVNMLPQYYEVRADGLFIRQGWRKVLVPYAYLAELQSTTDARSARVLDGSDTGGGTGWEVVDHRAGRRGGVPCGRGDAMPASGAEGLGAGVAVVVADGVVSGKTATSPSRLGSERYTQTEPRP